VESGELPVGVAFEVGDEFVVAEGCLFQDLQSIPPFQTFVESRQNCVNRASALTCKVLLVGPWLTFWK
jgi:hypothetical protein